MINNSTRVRTGYWIYSLWRFTAATQVTITMSTITLVALISETGVDSFRRPTDVD
jgi:hypothetical protein